MDSTELIKHIEEFTELISKEYYMQGAGLKQTVELDAIYKKFPGLFSKAKLELVRREAVSAPEGSDQQRKKVMLEEIFCSEIIAETNKDITGELLRLEGIPAINFDEHRGLSYRNLQMYIINEKDAEKRNKYRTIADDFVDENLNPLLERAFESETASIKQLGFENKAQMFTKLSGIDLAKLNDIMQTFLRETNDMYLSLLKEQASEKLGKNLNELHKDDLILLMKSDQFDKLFPKDKMLQTVSDFISAIGLDMYAGGRIRFDIEARHNKSPRAFCSPVKIPEEVYLVLYPAGGANDYTVFLHELGHAMHYANVDRSLPFEFRNYGDNSVTEGFAMFFDHLTMNEQWTNRYLGFNSASNAKYFRHKVFCELIQLRSYAGKIDYELKLTLSDNLKDKKDLYNAICEEAMKVKFSPTRYLIDIDTNFYCARYLRAWMFQALMHDKMNSAYGIGWIQDKAAGSILNKLWGLGQKYNADELAAELCGNNLSITPLLNNIKQHINYNGN